VSRAAEEARLGIQLCRKGDWRAGIQQLARAVETGSAAEGMPSEAYSFLGYGIALEQRRVQEGLSLCRHALRLDYTAPDNHLNLSRLHLLAGDRRAAIKVIGEALSIHPRYGPLLALYREMGYRQPPVLRFLSRSNLVNRWLGLLRHRLLRRP
jgi:tetratricopeptide (TPR) repeat protein